MRFALPNATGYDMRIALLFLLVLCGGCWSLPEGKPPAGEIVRQTAKDTLSPKAAEERLITALTMFTMTELPGQPIAVEAPETMLPLMKNVIQNVSAVSGIRQEGRTARFTFKAVNTGGTEWIFSILDNMKNKTVLWEDRFKIVAPYAN